MKILISHLPKHKWWGHGTPIYKDNPAMKQGMIPNQELVEVEMHMMTELFNRLPVEVIEVDFPNFLDQQNTDQRKHDFVFVRDLFISNQNGKVIISKFSEEARQVESDIMEIMLDSMGYETIRIPDSINAKAEGGEFYYCSGPKILFSGACRNNVKGAEWVAQEFGVNELVIMKSNVFHLDTLFTPVINKDNQLVAMIACTSLMEKESANDLKDFADKMSIELVEVNPEDSIGTKEQLGEFAVNCCPLPGYLIGPTRFRSLKVNELLKELEVMHITVPTTQFRLSGGSVHCLTNEL
ncbi:MAG: arginine deiminase-related protein [Candidatus Neomarinimicrobiota bacterium]|nr:arginine deiminase-related protein [Candidatus Neomarinimicrobiota bacterium]